MPPNETPEKKPGFFSRLFSWKKTSTPEIEEEAPPSPPSASVSSIPVSPAPVSPARPPSAPPPSALDQAARSASASAALTPAARPFAPPAAAPPQSAPSALDAAAQAPASRPSFFARLKERLTKTKSLVVQKVKQAIGLSGKVDDALLEEIEAILIQADVGPTTTERIIKRMRVLAKDRDPKTPNEVIAIFKEVMTEIICRRTKTFEINREIRPYVVLVTGVNGTGKTTTIGKMAKRCSQAGVRCMLIAADTFRAAAIEQLEIWAARTGSLFVRGAQDADPASVCFDGLQKAQRENVDVVFIDTAGRLHTKMNLMEELRKIRRVIQKVQPAAPHETLLVLDATTGQNAIQQTKIFQEAAQLTGLVMTKLDGTAKGGVLIAIRDLFEIPICLIGIGESEDDLRDFDPRLFVEALFAE